VVKSVGITNIMVKQGFQLKKNPVFWCKHLQFSHFWILLYFASFWYKRYQKAKSTILFIQCKSHSNWLKCILRNKIADNLARMHKHNNSFFRILEYFLLFQSTACAFGGSQQSDSGTGQRKERVHVHHFFASQGCVLGTLR
jgi:hypothetical protein